MLQCSMWCTGATSSHFLNWGFVTPTYTILLLTAQFISVNWSRPYEHNIQIYTHKRCCNWSRQLPNLKHQWQTYCRDQQLSLWELLDCQFEWWCYVSYLSCHRLQCVWVLHLSSRVCRWSSLLLIHLCNRNEVAILLPNQYVHTAIYGGYVQEVETHLCSWPMNGRKRPLEIRTSWLSNFFITCQLATSTPC